MVGGGWVEMRTVSDDGRRDRIWRLIDNVRAHANINGVTGADIHSSPPLDPHFLIHDTGCILDASHTKDENNLRLRCVDNLLMTVRCANTQPCSYTLLGLLV